MLTRQTGLSFPRDVIVAKSLADASEQLQAQTNLGRVFVIGGEQIYAECIKSGLVNRVVYTEVSNVGETTKFDAFFPNLDKSEWECRPFEMEAEDKENSTPSNSNDAVEHVDKKSGLRYKFMEYTRISIPEGGHVNPEEMQYLEMCRDIIANGVSLVLQKWFDTHVAV